MTTELEYRSIITNTIKVSFQMTNYYKRWKQSQRSRCKSFLPKLRKMKTVFLYDNITLILYNYYVNNIAHAH